MPAAAIPVIAGVAAGAASTLVVTTATAIAIGSAVMSATMMLTMKKPSLGDYTSASERSQVLRAAASDKSCVYGRVISSGLMSFAAEEPGEQDEGEWLHLALVLSGTKLTRIGDIWLGDDVIGTYGDLVSWELHIDRQTADPYLLDKCADWKSDMIGQGITWLRLSLKFDAEKFPAGLPNIKIEKFGKEVWDPRDNKWKWSDNSALVILDYYRSWLGVPDDEIRMDEFIVAANICDEIVTVADGKVEPRYTTNVEFDLTEPRAKVLEALHMACCGQPTYIGGQFGILAGAYYGPASDELRPYQLIGDLELLPEPSSSDKINQVAGTFVDPITFKKTDFPAVIVPQWVEEDGGQPLLEDLDLRCVTSEHQAQRIANIILRQRRAASTVTCSVNLSGWRYRPGQTIRFYLPAMGINGTEYRVTDWSFSLDGGVDLTLREDSPDFWADAIGKPMERPTITELPTGGVAMPDQLRYDVETVGEVVQGVLSWRNSGTVNYNQVIVQRIEPGKAPVTVLTAQVPGQSCRVNGLAAGNYVGQVRAIAMTGAPSPVASVSFTIAVPAIPVGVEVEAGNWSLAFRPVFTGGQSYGALCEWWWSKVQLPLAEVQAKATQAGLGAYMTFQGLQPDTTYYVWLRAVNAYGKSGLFAASGKTTYDAASILDVLDGEIGAEHLREELRQPIEQIPSIVGQLEQVDQELTDLSETVAPIAERVPVIDQELTGLGSALAALDERATQTESLLRDEQDSLGEMGIGTVLEQDKLHGKIDRVQSEMGDLRDAIFTVNPGTGEIEMDVVRALRDETQASFTEVNQTLDAVTGTLATKADQAIVDAQGSRLTEAEQVLDGINATLTQTVTKSEFTSEQQRLTEVSDSLDAAMGEIQQKAAQSTVTEQGERLAAAEQQIIVNSDAQSALAERVSGLKAELEAEDQTLQANITEVARVSTEADQVLAQRVSGVEVRTDTAEGAIRALEEIVESDSVVTAGRFDEITATLDLTAKAADQAAEAAIANALAGDTGEQRHRQAEASIRRDQQVQLDLHQALAREVTELDARFEGEKADTAANFTDVREVIADADQANAQQITQLRAEYQAADLQTNAALESKSKTLADADSALGQRIDQVQASVNGNASAIQSEATTRANADSALGQRVDQVQATAEAQAATITGLAKTVSDNQQASALALQQLDTKTNQTNATVGTLAEALSEQGEALAGRQDDLAAEVDLTALASVGNTLADDQDEGRTRKARAEITRRQDTQADEHQALAREVTQFRAEFEGEQAATSAALTGVREAISGVEQSTAREISQLRSDYQAADLQTNAALEESKRTLSAADQAMSERVTQLQAQVTEGDQTLNAAILQTQQAQVEGDQANANSIATVQANLNNTNAAVQSGATATANLRGEVEAGWYTKAEINGEGGGFGLSVEMNADGTVLSSFVIDADVFAVLSRAGGVATKRHPFIVKNGTVYMNHAMMDTAEIGSVIAKYINVQHLIGTLIEGGSFRGGDLWIGENANGSFGAYGKRWNAGIDSSGRIYGSNVYFESGTFQGNVLALSGTMNNVTIKENCQILGKLSVNQIEGDVTRVYALESYITSDRVSFTIPAFSRTRNLVISGIEIYARGSTQGGGGDHADKEITNSASCSITVNGSTTSDSVSATGSGNFTSTVCGRTVVIPPNQVTSVTIAFTGGYRVRGSVAMVFTQ
ncbi:phage tail tip protein J-related protein [Aeromonas caviae]